MGHSSLQWMAPAHAAKRRSLLAIAGLVLVLSAYSSLAQAPDIDEARALFISGQYDAGLKLAQEGARLSRRSEDWRIVLIECLMATGRYPEALAALIDALPATGASIRLRLLGYGVQQANGDVAAARGLLEEINELAGTRMWNYRNAPSLVALGKTAVLLGADPRQVLEQFFDRVKKADPDFRDAWLAAGELALSKHDDALAAKSFQDALARFPKDPDLHFGLAQAFASSDRQEMIAALEATLAANPNHVGARLLMADHLILAEDYASAEAKLAEAIAINPWQPEAWAYRAVIAHLKNDRQEEATARKNALKFWPTNPKPDHIIGQKLSQKYRFAEGSARQRTSLAFDPKFLPAKIQLAQDFLRLGDEEDGWKLIEEVHQADAYNVEAYNLATLKDTLSKFHSITNESFIVRMSPQEVKLYGDRVMQLLERAKTHLCEKYEMKPSRPTVVEIYPNPSDFAVRTFGMPGNPGYLGVCFGCVITANSPASQAGHPANWEAVLWHEFCHVVTLQLTRNRIPRWLSEGISVYEERRANPVWGEHMNAAYREMTLGDALVPVSKLSGAFMAPPSPLHLQFAYYESSLVVEFMIDRFGLDSLKKILHDLGEGIEVNQAIAQHAAPLDSFESEFTAFAHKRANALGPDLDWTKPGEKMTDLSALHPKNYYRLVQEAQKLLKNKRWEDAKAPLQRLIELYPSQTGPGNAYSMLARAYRELGQTESERKTLSALAALDSDATDVYLRLMELAGEAGEWEDVIQNAARALAVNPLLPEIYRRLAQAGEAARRPSVAIPSYRALLAIDPADTADLHFKLALNLHRTGDPSARRHLVQALEETPRFREALDLLLAMNTPAPVATPAPANSQSPESSPTSGPERTPRVPVIEPEAPAKP